MNKLKVAVQALRDYLGKDSRGVALLGDISEIANAHRKRIAALEEAATMYDSTLEHIRRERDAAKHERDSLRGDLERESAKRAAAESRNAALLDLLKPTSEPESVDGETETSKVLSLLKLVRKRFPKLPVTGGKGDVNIGGLMVEDFIKVFAHDEFAGLGMALAACAYMNLPLMLRAEKPLKGGDLMRDGKEAEMARFVHWFRDAIYTTRAEDGMYARTAY